MADKRSKHTVVVGIVCVTLVTLIIILALSIFSRTVTHAVENNVTVQLKEVSLQQEKIMNDFINSKLDILKATANMLSYENDLNSRETIEYLNNASSLSDFTAINFCQADGTFYSILTNESSSASDTDYFKAAMSGQAYVSDIIVSQFNEEKVIILSVPVYQNNTIVGILCGISNTDSFGDLFEISSFNGLGYVGIIDNNFNLIATASASKDIFISALEHLPDTAYYNNNTYSQIIEGFQSEKEFYSVFDINDVKSYTYFVPLEFNDWYLCSVTPASAIDTYTKPILNAYSKLSVLVGIVINVCMLAIIVTFRKYQKLLISKVDESKQKLSQEEVYNKSLLKNSITTSKYDIDDDKFIEMPTSWIKLFGLNPDGGYDEVIGGLAEASVHPDDRGRFLAVSKEYLKECYEKGIPNIELRYRRILDKNGAMKWMKNIMYISKDPVTGHIISMAVVEDIDEENRKLEALKNSAESDSLTGLYNRKSLVDNIENYFKYDFGQGSTAVLMMVDVDDFKHINDTMGHRYGDKVLRQISAAIRKEFRSSDVFGRLGGDEFVIFCKDVVSAEYARKKAQSFCDYIKQQETENDEIKISCSVGFCVAPDDGMTFEELYENADIAMYNAKKLGKGRCMKFEKTMKQKTL